MKILLSLIILIAQSFDCRYFRKHGHWSFYKLYHQWKPANNSRKANTIPTDPSDPKYDASRLYLIGQPLSADPKGYKPGFFNEGGTISSPNVLPGFNSMSVFHDKFTEDTFLGKEGFLELSILPAIPINYYGLIGKELRNLYEEPKNNNSTGGKP
jgi:hypothetical protein